MENSTHEELKKLGIGRKIRVLREEKEISLEALSEQVDLALPLLSQIEDDVIPPTLATLVNISRSLGVGIDHFFTKQESVEKIEYTPENERLTVSKSRESDEARMTYNYQTLAYRLKGKRMEPFLVEFDSEIEEDLIPLSHKGEEFGFCLEGEIEFITDERRIRLRPGDAIYFYSEVPHAIKGIGPGKPKALFVLLPEQRPESE